MGNQQLIAMDREERLLAAIGIRRSEKFIANVLL
jgi:hypothetical protein